MKFSKTKYLLLMPIIAFAFAACSDDNTTPPVTPPGGDSSKVAAYYYPTDIGNKWNYTGEIYLNDSTESSGKFVLATTDNEMQVTDLTDSYGHSAFKFDEKITQHSTGKADSSYNANPVYRYTVDSKIYNLFTPAITDISPEIAKYFTNFDFGFTKWLVMADFELGAGEPLNAFDTTFSTVATLPTLVGIIGTDSVKLKVDIKVITRRKNDSTITIDKVKTSCAGFDYDISFIVTINDPAATIYNGKEFLSANILQTSWYALNIGCVQSLERNYYEMLENKQNSSEVFTSKNIKNYTIGRVAVGG